MKKLIAFLIIYCIAPKIWPQEKPFNITLHGFVAVDAAHNTRQSSVVRNKHIYRYPLPKKFENGVDINKQSTLDIDAAHSRIGAHIQGPTLQGVTVFGMLEGDFLGTSPTTDTNYRLRHAYIQLGYKNFNLIAGQTWHPFFIPNYYPLTLNSNVGAPIHPLNRNPQIRFTHNTNNWFEWSISFIEQNNFRSAGFPQGTEKSNFPEIDLQIQLGGSNNFKAALTAGYKQLAVPLPNEQAWKKHPIVKSKHFQSNFFITLPQWTIRTGAVYGENLTEHSMPGGVGVTLTSSQTENPKYEPLAIVTSWLDVNSNWTKIDPGLFIGYLENLGAAKKVVVDKNLSNDPNLAHLWAISPRLRYHVTPQACVGVEYLYTLAAWSENEQLNQYGKPQTVESVHNHRTLLSVRYSF